MDEQNESLDNFVLTKGSRNQVWEGQKDRTDHTNLFPRSFTESGLTEHKKVNFSTFYGKLESHFTTEWFQIRLFRPCLREHKLLFLILTYSSNHLKNHKKWKLGSRFPKQNQLCFLKQYQNKKKCWGNARVSQNLHLLWKWLPFVMPFCGFS